MKHIAFSNHEFRDWSSFIALQGVEGVWLCHNLILSDTPLDSVVF